MVDRGKEREDDRDEEINKVTYMRELGGKCLRN